MTVGGAGQHKSSLDSYSDDKRVLVFNIVAMTILQREKEDIGKSEPSFLRGKLPIFKRQSFFWRRVLQQRNLFVLVVLNILLLLLRNARIAFKGQLRTRTFRKI